jgi:hypothetical protein
MAFNPFFELDVEGYDDDTLAVIASEILDSVISRTEGGLDKNGNPFPKYSPEYIKEKGQSNVDLTFSGEMLSELTILNSSNDKIKIGYAASNAALIGRVEGNVLGTYGNSRPVTAPRDFLGIPPSDLNTILDNFPKTSEERLEKRVQELKEAAKRAREIFSDLEFEAE